MELRTRWDVQSVTFPEQEWLQLRPNLLTSPVLITEDVCCIDSTFHMVELDDASSAGLTDTMIGLHCVSSVETTIRDAAAVNLRLVITKTNRGPKDGDSKVTERESDVNSLVSRSATGNKL